MRRAGRAGRRFHLCRTARCPAQASGAAKMQAQTGLTAGFDFRNHGRPYQGRDGEVARFAAQNSHDGLAGSACAQACIQATGEHRYRSREAGERENDQELQRQGEADNDNRLACHAHNRKEGMKRWTSLTDL